jgi:ParB family chromosome partitioning protein
MQLEIAQRIAKQGWSVRETENAVRRIAGPTAAKAGGSPRQPQGDPNVRRLESDLAETLGASVTIEHGPKGGRVVIRYNGLEELEGILSHIK